MDAAPSANSPSLSVQGGTPSRRAPTNSHRLLYRGALSLPDSHLPLDGLSFTTNVSEPCLGNSPSASLLENPLALALESMRGRPLHLKGSEKLQNVWLDSTIDIHVYVHPESVITQIYFENIFCLSPVTSADRRTDMGIRIGLSDSGSVDDFIIYGQVRPQPPSSKESLPSSSSKPPETLHILATRILPYPPARVPRPDDPTPRKPSAYLLNGANKRKRDVSNASIDIGESTKPLKGNTKGKGRDVEDEQLRVARDVMTNMPKPDISLPRMLGRDMRLGAGKGAEVFKVPPLPARTRSQPNIEGSGCDDGDNEPDVFGEVKMSVDVKGKACVTERSGFDELEKANKTVIKQATITCLSRHGVDKGHTEFNELFSATYRGAAFALRNIIRIQAVNPRTVEKLLEAHARLYITGNGGNHPAGADPKKGKT